MTASIFPMLGSVNSRNLVPVSVWKHVNRNFSVSRNSSPEAGTEAFGYEYAAWDVDDGALGADPDVGVPEGDDVAGAGVAWAVGILGVIERVIACTLFTAISLSSLSMVAIYPSLVYRGEGGKRGLLTREMSPRARGSRLWTVCAIRP